MAGLLC